MKNIEVIIATRNRYRKLLRMIRSVPLEAEGIPIRIKIICDGDGVSHKQLLDQGFETELMPSRRGAVFCRNLLTSKASDAILYGTDDIIFRKGAIESAVRSMRRFADDDGVIGFNQEGNGGDNFSKSGVALIGYPFLLRYPGKKLFYPRYHHFACQEIERAATLLRRFYFDEKAMIYHYHPSFNPKEIDATHLEARKFRRQDRALSSKRRAAKLTWGING